MKANDLRTWAAPGFVSYRLPALTTTVTLDVAAGAPDSTPATLTPDASATVAYALLSAGAALGRRVRKDILWGDRDVEKCIGRCMFEM